MIRFYDPFRELDRVAGRAGSFSRSGPSARAYRFDDRLELHYDLPGVDPATIELSVEGRDVTLSAERTATAPEGAQLVWGSQPQAGFRQTVSLAETYDVDRLEAHAENGVLVVGVPVAETSQPRKVQVASGAAAAIETTATE